MNNIKITKAKNGRGYFLDIEEVIYQAPLTALELLSLAKMIKDMEQKLLEDLN